MAIAEGAAWVAHDEAQLHLAKNIELVLARNSYVALLEAGLEMPSEGEQRQERFSLYCVDPSDGFGKFSIVSPHRPGPLVGLTTTEEIWLTCCLKWIEKRPHSASASNCRYP